VRLLAEGIMSDPFWAQGLRFECQRSGRCCTNHGENTCVYVTLDDRRRLAAFFGQPTSAFTRSRCVEADGRYLLRDETADCVFFDQGGCSVYEARPTQCRTWPFWPENMKRRVWLREIAAFCPGVGRGRLFSRGEIEALLALDEE
jgi:Fe-S-cluster containining protein